MTRSNPEQRRRERGQMLILAMLFMTIVFVIGFIVVDVTLWLTERRGAQKDADAVALAGAYELLSQNFVNPSSNNFAAIKSAAEAAAYQWADFNELPDEDVHNLVVDDTNCLGPSPVLDTVSLDAEHHTRALFASIFGLFVPQIGAHAKACLGSITTATGLLPVGIQIAGWDSDCWQDVDGDGEEDPLFGQECILTFGASETASGEAGNLRLFNDEGYSCSARNTGGNNTYLDEVRSGGASTECHVYKYFEDPSKGCSDDPGGCVYPLTGVGATPQLKAFEDLMATEGECDRLPGTGNGDGIDQFLEVVEAADGDATPSPDTLFSRRDCESPRLVSLIIVRRFTAQGNDPLPIEAFASFYVSGCTNSDGTVFSQKCRQRDFPGAIGQVRLKGFFVNLLEVSGAVGQISKWSPKKITVVE